MFYPEAMTEIELIVPSKDLFGVTKALSGQGIFQQTDTNYLRSEKVQRNTVSWQETAASFASLERRIMNIMQILEMEEGRPPSAEFEELTDISQATASVDQIEAVVKQVNDQLIGEQKRIEQNEMIIRQLEPAADVDLDISSLRKSRYLTMTLGTMPTDHIGRLQASLERVPTVFVNLRHDPQKSIVWIAGMHQNAPILERAMRSAYFSPLSLPEGYQGTPSEIIQRMQANTKEATQKIGELKGVQAQQRKTYQRQLQELLWDIRSNRMLSEAILRFGQLQYTYLIVGWVPTARLDGLLQKLREASSQIMIESFPMKRNSNRNDIPVALSTNPLLRPFQELVVNFARPRYDEIDPTILIAITFPLLFGAMFGDVGHGLVLALVGALLASGRIQSMRGMKGLGGLITACGGMSIVFGFLYGSIFGLEHVIPALWMHPMEHILDILMVAVGAGVVLLTIGFLLGMYNAFVARNWVRLIFDHNGLVGFVLYWSLIGLAGSLFVPNMNLPTTLFAVLAIISGAMVTISEVLENLVEGHRPLIESGLATYAIQAFFELFETLIGFLSNSLSYVRVGAFAVAHGGLSAVIFILADMAGGGGHGVGYFVALLIGNAFIIFVEGLIVGIQTMRLEYYEFFSKFFTGGGARYEPLSLQPVTEK